MVHFRGNGTKTKTYFHFLISEQLFLSKLIIVWNLGGFSEFDWQKALELSDDNAMTRSILLPDTYMTPYITP